MDIGYGNAVLTVHQHKSAKGLEEYVDAASGNGLIVGAGKSEENAFESISFTYYGEKNKRECRIGVISEGVAGGGTRVYLLPDQDAILLSYDWCVAKIDLKKLDVVFQVYCEGIVFMTHCIQEHDVYVIIHELGAVSVGPDGKELRRQDAEEVVTDYWFERDSVVLSLWGGKRRSFQYCEEE